MIRSLPLVLAGALASACLPTTGQSDGGGADGGTSGLRTCTAKTKITPSVAFNAWKVGVLPSGNLVVSELNATRRLHEMKPDGTVVASNSTDFGASNAAGMIQVSRSGKIFVSRGRDLARLDNGVTGPVTNWISPLTVAPVTLGALGLGGPNDSTLMVALGNPSQLQKYDATASTGGTGTTVTNLNGTGLAVAPDGTAYLADGYNCTVQRIPTSGAASQIIGGGCVSGAAMNGRVGQGDGLVIDARGHLLYGDWSSNNIKDIELLPNGETNITIACEEPNWAPKALALAADGTLYAVDETTHAVWKVDF